jgi:photosystem II stability/assembly factor-like uncharacterized protein
MKPDKSINRMKKLFSLFLIIVSIEGCQKDDLSTEGWTALSCGETISDLNSVFFTDENTGYATGFNETPTPYSVTGFILKTTDAGRTWSSIRIDGESINWLFNIFFSDTNTGYVTGYRPESGALLLKTTDGGTTWNKITLDTAKLLRLTSANFIEVNTGYLTGYKNKDIPFEWYGTILKTSDGGNSWSALNITTPEDAVLNSICFPDVNIGYIAGPVYTGGGMYNGIFLKTVDGGATWSNKSTTVRCAFKSIYFTDKNTGFGVGETIVGTGESTLIKTTDGGNTWNTVTLPTDTPIALNSICFADENTGYAVGSQGYNTLHSYKSGAAILKTTDGGLTWKLTLIKNAGPLNSIHIFNSKTVYAVGKNGTILKEATN